MAQIDSVDKKRKNEKTTDSADTRSGSKKTRNENDVAFGRRLIDTDLHLLGNILSFVPNEDLLSMQQVGAQFKSVGVSKLRGKPDLPKDGSIKWPEGQQFYLSDQHASPVRRIHHCQVHHGDAGSWHAVLFLVRGPRFQQSSLHPAGDDESTLEESQEVPEDVEVLNNEIILGFCDGLSLPGEGTALLRKWKSYSREMKGGEPASEEQKNKRQDNDDDKDNDDDIDLHGTMRDFFNDKCDYMNGNHMFGYATFCCHGIGDVSTTDNELLLLQLDNDEQFPFCDAGMGYFLMPRGDLVAGNFSTAEGYYDCS